MSYTSGATFRESRRERCADQNREDRVNSRIRLKGLDAAFQNINWVGTELARIGRLETLEIVLDDGSVSRRHAEVRLTPRGWRLRDLKSTNGTFLNGTQVGSGDWPLRPRDQIRCGNVTLVIEAIEESAGGEVVEGGQMQVEATASVSWEDALNRIAFDRDRSPRPGEQILALLRASHHLGHIDDEEELLHSILNDAVSALDSQRGAIVLAQGPNNALRLRALATGGRKEPSGRHCFSQSLAQRSFTQGESILCHSVQEDPELAIARSIAEGAMSSVICALLRTPRKRLGVLHLDRSPWQKPFTKDDLLLADALAASVSAGIESAQLLHKQRDLFFSTITTLAQAVEMRDEYTGGHTARVTTYSLLLGRQLKLSAEDINVIRMGGPLHDIGKIGIDDAILKKPGRLTPEEFEIMKSHTVKGAAILQLLPDLAPVIPIVRSHHERWDGKGYPDGTAGEATPRLARIVAVADAFDAMTSDRPYRAGMPAEAAFAEVQKQSGMQFDPECAAGFLAIRERIEQEISAPSTSDKPATALLEAAVS
jgi:putative nucleotidyltransferase with HDIG domain